MLAVDFYGDPRFAVMGFYERAFNDPRLILTAIICAHNIVTIMGT